MRCVVQRVRKASVKVNHQLVGEIGTGLLIFVGVGQDDDQNDCEWLADKIVGLRIFEDQEEKMNLSVSDIGGELLLVSQFTLLGDCRKGKRPSFSKAASPEIAKELFDELVVALRKSGSKVEIGQFQANMDVELLNQGPVTILLDSKKHF